MQKIEILEIIPSYTKANGVGNFVNNLASSINKKKYNITTIAIRSRRDESMKAHLQKNEVATEDTTIDDGFFKFMRNLRRILNEKNISIIHCNVPQAAAYVFPLAKKYGVKTRINHSHVVKSS